MVSTIAVNAKQDFWHRLCRTRPLRAISEIVWNSLDADAERVSVSFKRCPLGGLEEIVIEDDGHGIPIGSDAEHRFAALGGSLKAKSPRTEQKRLVHGRYGEGRFRAFSLGEIVSWKTVYRELENIRSYEITGNVSMPGQFFLSDVHTLSEGEPGTTVTVKNPEKHDGVLLAGNFREDIARVFAPYLLNYREIELSVDGKKIDTNDIVARRKEVSLPPVRLNGGEYSPRSWRSWNGIRLQVDLFTCVTKMALHYRNDRQT